MSDYSLNHDLIKNHLVNHFGWSPTEAKQTLRSNPQMIRDVMLSRISIVEACDMLDSEIGE